MIVSPDKSGRIDPVVFNFLQHVDSSIPLVPITRLENYQFNDSLLSLSQYVVLNFCEFDHNFTWERGTPVFGKNIDKFQDKFSGEEWRKLNGFVSNNPPVLTFQRELLETDRTERLLPIEWPCLSAPYPVQTKQSFDERRIEVFNFWGYSHDSRRQLHGDLFKNASRNNVGIVDNVNHISQELKDNKKIWVSTYTPYYARFSMNDILGLNGLSKLSLSLPGAGIKCFRHCEAPVNSVMVMQEDDLAWTYEWVHGVNCIKFTDNPIETIEATLKRDDLYNIYLEGVKTVDKYRAGNYINNYIIPNIEKRIN